MLSHHLLLVCLVLVDKVSSLYIEKMACLYPLRSSIQPCSCLMLPDVEDDGRILGTLKKSLTCNLDEILSSDDNLSFEKIAQAFYHDNRIDELRIQGHGRHSGFVFLTEEDLGRLNVSKLSIDLSLNIAPEDWTRQKLFHAGAFKGSDGSLSKLKVQIANTYAVDPMGLEFLKPICPALKELELHGAFLVMREHFEGCSQVESLRLILTTNATISPDSFEGLKNIKTMDFFSPELLIETDAFQHFDNLEKLQFRQTSFHDYYDQYPDYDPDTRAVIRTGAFKSLPKLHTLSFSVNVDLFEELSFLGLEKLGMFKVYGGRQPTLPRLFDSAPQLIIFRFSSRSDGLEVLEEDAFDGLSNLEVIDLRHNKLTTLNKAFHGLHKLEYIDLGYNKLTTIDNAFRDLPALQEIDLTGNNLKSLNNAFIGLPHPFIKLSSNTKLTTLSSPLKEIVHSGGNILLDGIPLDCGCDMRWLAREPTIVTHIKATCADGQPLAVALEAAQKTLYDIVDGGYVDIEDEDMVKKTVFDIACPSDGED